MPGDSGEPLLPHRPSNPKEDVGLLRTHLLLRGQGHGFPRRGPRLSPAGLSGIYLAALCPLLRTPQSAWGRAEELTCGRGLLRLPSDPNSRHAAGPVRVLREVRAFRCSRHGAPGPSRRLLNSPFRDRGAALGEGSESGVRSFLQVSWEAGGREAESSPLWAPGSLPHDGNSLSAVVKQQEKAIETVLS